MRHDEILGLLPWLNFRGDQNPGLMLLLYELLFWLVVAGLTAWLLRKKPAIFEVAEARLRAISQHTRLSLISFVLAVIVVRTAMLPWIPVPVPIVHDEFSYLLGADTFAHGRLTNPPSPMWEHFESFHMNVLPTYQSMYPPGQGMALAAGEKLTGVPWVGVVLSIALMCGALYWMLLGWLPAPWAWLGGAFAVIRFGVFSYWINSYWGGAVAAIGGALLLGALPRLRKRFDARIALVAVVGLLIMANSRPLEGFLFSVPLTLAILWSWWKQGSGARWRASVALAPATALLLVGFSWMLYFNWRGTGDPLLMPYTVNFKTYHISKPFMFQKPNPVPVYHHQAMRTFYVFHEMGDVTRLRYEGWEAAVGMMVGKANVNYAFFLWPFLFMLAPALYAVWRSELRVVLIAVLFVAIDLLAQIWPAHSHYAAPATGAIILLLLFSLRHFRNTNHEVGVWASRAFVSLLALWMISPTLGRFRDPYNIFPTGGTAEDQQMLLRSGTLPAQLQRARLQAELDARRGPQLVIVHHPYHDVPSMDWIYNEADIEHAHVVWARDMGVEKNRELLDHYAGREVSYVDRGDMAARLVPYDDIAKAWNQGLGASDQMSIALAGWETGKQFAPVGTSAAVIAKSAQRPPVIAR